MESDASCCKRGIVAAIEVLIRYNAKIDIVRGSTGSTPLHIAIEFRQIKALQALVDLGANLEARDDKGRTALFYAARWGHVEAVEVLLQAGASRDSVNCEEEGQRPFKPEIVEVFKTFRKRKRTDDSEQESVKRLCP